MSTAGVSRRYGQYCGLARALDVIGDRWTLLIVRELLVEPRRFGELHEGLCGVATNLLTRRLRSLEANGLIERTIGDPGSGTRYALTGRGEALRPAIDELIRWSAPLMAEGPEDDAFRAAWLAVALPALLPEGSEIPSPVGLETGGAALVLEAGAARPVVRRRRAEDSPCPATLAADPAIVLGLASGALDVDAAVRAGATVRGDRAALERAFGGRRPEIPTAGTA